MRATWEHGLMGTWDGGRGWMVQRKAWPSMVHGPFKRLRQGGRHGAEKESQDHLLLCSDSSVLFISGRHGRHARWRRERAAPATAETAFCAIVCLCKSSCEPVPTWHFFQDDVVAFLGNGKEQGLTGLGLFLSIPANCLPHCATGLFQSKPVRERYVAAGCL